MCFQVSLFDFALLIFLVKSGAGSQGLHVMHIFCAVRLPLSGKAAVFLSCIIYATAKNIDFWRKVPILLRNLSLLLTLSLWTDLCRSLELPVAASRGWMSKAEYVQQVLTAFPAALPATASVRGDLYL